MKHAKKIMTDAVLDGGENEFGGRFMEKVYGYCRCSTDENKQDISRQVRELKEMGAVPETIFTEYISGMKENKVELQKLLNVIRSGDTLAVTELSRLTRSTKQLCDIIETVKNKQIKLIIKDSITIDCSSLSPDYRRFCRTGEKHNIGAYQKWHEECQGEREADRQTAYNR